MRLLRTKENYELWNYQLQLIRCTKQLLEHLQSDGVVNVHPIREALGSWHAKICMFGGEKSVLVTNDSTLYSFLIPQLTNNDFANFRRLFIQHLLQNLMNEGIMQSKIDIVLEEHNRVFFSEMNNQTVLDVMKEHASHLKFVIHKAGGLQDTNVFETNKMLNRKPLKVIDNRLPITLLKERLYKGG